ncbi:MAG: AAA family ATPase [Desulfovibrionaceae bacterium]|nr:AAA family ATPase [Desulfovibrionaceae bacterium]
MKLSGITIKNYRALEDVRLTFNSGMNVIYGRNGMGKSSVIDLLGFFLAGLEGAAQEERARELVHGCRDISREISVLAATDQGAKTRISIEPGTGRVTVQGTARLPIRHLSFTGGMTAQSAPENGGRSGSGGLRGSSVGRRVNLARVKERMHCAQLAARCGGARGRRVPEAPFRRKMGEALHRLDAGFGGVRVESGEGGKRLLVEKNGVFLDAERDLSSGELLAVGLLAEICCEACAGPGRGDLVVLVDEIDISLHPQWQVRMAAILREFFPEVQFVMTSHSPFVWSGMNREEVVWLDAGDDGRVYQRPAGSARGESLEGIATHYFGLDAYDSAFLLDLHKVDVLIELGDGPAARQAADALAKRYGGVELVSMLEFRMRLRGL